MSNYIYTTNAKFNSIVIIESLMPNDIKTGVMLETNLKLLCSNKKLPIDIFLFSVKNKEELKNLFEKLSNKVSTSNFRPLIHFEIHGWDDRTGMAMTEANLNENGHINWDEFCDMTRPLNKLMANNLFITMSVCYGFYAITDIRLSEVAPFWGVIGSDKPILESDLIKFFPSLFENIFLGKYIDDVVADINEQYSNSQIRYTTSDKIFIQSMKLYFDNIKNNPDEFDRRVENLIEQAKRGAPEPHDGFYKNLAISYLNCRDYNKDFFLDKSSEFLCRNDEEFIGWMTNNFNTIYK